MSIAAMLGNSVCTADDEEGEADDINSDSDDFPNLVNGSQSESDEESDETSDEEDVGKNSLSHSTIAALLGSYFIVLINRMYTINLLTFNLTSQTHTGVDFCCADIKSGDITAPAPSCGANTSHNRTKRRPPRAPASTDRFAVAAELLATRCSCSVNCTYTLNKNVHDLVDRVIDARDRLQECRTKSSAEIFSKLERHRRAPIHDGEKYVVHFFFAGFEICGDTWCALHGLRMGDSRMKQVLAALRDPAGNNVWNPKSALTDRQLGCSSWRGDWCRAWFRRHVKTFAEFDPVKMTASLDPEAVETRHMLYDRDWKQRSSGSKSGESISIIHFRRLWDEYCENGYVEDGSVFAIKIRPPRSGFTCSICQHLIGLRKKATTRCERDDITFQLNQHLQQAREARESYADQILNAQLNSMIASLSIDAADQAKHHCPLIAFTSRASGKIQKIIQQFIGALDHNVGYALFRRLPYTQKGANLTLTILIEMIRRKHLAGKSEWCIQWDGASENVAKTNLRFFIWLLLLCDTKGLPLTTITVCRSIWN